MSFVPRYRGLTHGYRMQIRRVARRNVADGFLRLTKTDLGNGGEGSEQKERGAQRLRPRQRVTAISAHVGGLS